jgi:putative phage-type endonuclease
MKQGTPEWLAARLGHVTASRFSDVLAKGKGITREKYLIQIVCERLTGLSQPEYVNGAMEWGTEQEPFARMAYEVKTQAIVQEVGFIKHPTMARVGGSPDGLIGDNGGVQIKCPSSHVHIATIRNGMPSEHRAQVQGEMAVTNRTWWDFVSYDPRMPEPLQLYIERIKRDDDYIEQQLVPAVLAFLREVDEVIAELMERAK